MSGKLIVFLVIIALSQAEERKIGGLFSQFTGSDSSSSNTSTANNSNKNSSFLLEKFVTIVKGIKSKIPGMKPQEESSTKSSTEHSTGSTTEPCTDLTTEPSTHTTTKRSTHPTTKPSTHSTAKPSTDTDTGGVEEFCTDVDEYYNNS